MTEVEWNACFDPTPMLKFLRGKTSDRKLRLFACACCRRIWGLVTKRGLSKAVEVAELFADRAASKQELRTMRLTAVNLAEFHEATAVLQACSAAQGSQGSQWLTTAVVRASHAARMASARGASEERKQAVLLRDIFGSLQFRPATLSSSCLAWNDGVVRKLAQAIYDDRAFDRLPLLADALEEAGCADAAILGHCRGPGEHVRGCWVVDLLLGKH